MTIRAEQMRVLDRAAAAVFSAWAVAHIRRFFPGTCAGLGNAALETIVREGIERAARYGIDSGPGVAKFLDLMFLFGRHFDEDAGLPWAAEILNRAGIKKARKMEALFMAAGSHMAEARGLDGKTAADAW